MHTKRFRRLDWIEVVGSLGPLTPCPPFVGPDGAVYGPDGQLVAPAVSEHRRHAKLRVAEANRIARITAAKRSLNRGHGPVRA